MLTVHAAAETTATVQDDAVRAAYNQGITIVAAAGNNDVSLSPSLRTRTQAANKSSSIGPCFSAFTGAGP